MEVSLWKQKESHGSGLFESTLHERLQFPLRLPFDSKTIWVWCRQMTMREKNLANSLVCTLLSLALSQFATWVAIWSRNLVPIELPVNSLNSPSSSRPFETTRKQSDLKYVRCLTNLIVSFRWFAKCPFKWFSRLERFFAYGSSMWDGPSHIAHFAKHRRKTDLAEFKLFLHFASKSDWVDE